MSQDHKQDEHAEPLAAGQTLREPHRDMLAQLGELCGVRLELKRAEQGAPADAASAPVLVGGGQTGWLVAADGNESRHQWATRLASRMIGAELAAERQAEAAPARGRYEEQRVDFLYEMSQSVGALLDEQRICEFVVEKAARLLQCDRASLMLYDHRSRMLKIRASMGVPKHIAETAQVQPGERISGKVFKSGREVVVGAEDPPPDESLGVRELRDSPAFLSVPLTVPSEEVLESQILGVVNLTGRSGSDAFTAEDLKVVHTVAAHAAAQIRNCRLLDAERERRRLDEQLQIASQIQMSLLPQEPLSAGPLEVAGVCRPAQRVRGDFFDYWQQDGRVCVVVADVSGHDLGAALLATAFRSVVRTVAGDPEPVAQLVARINRAVYADLFSSEMLITLCYLEIRPESGMLTVCRCGHPYPLLLRGEEEIWLKKGGPLLGLEQDAQFEEESLRLEPGDALVVCTDGVLEAAPSEERQFGVEGLVKALRAGPRVNAPALAGAVIGAVERHMDGVEMTDDATVVAACFAHTGGSQASSGRAGG